MTNAINPRQQSQRDQDLALCRSVLYQALSLGFRRPTPRTCERLADSQAIEALAEAAAHIDVHEETRLESLARRLIVSEPECEAVAPATSYERLFGHTVRGPIPPYETEYGEDTLFQKPHEMSDAAGFLRAFGLALDPHRHERIDHISCQLEFLAFLTRKEAHAVECGDEAMLSETRRATRLYLKDHLGRFAPSFARRIVETDPGGFYGRLAALCLAFVTLECERLAIRSGPQTLRLRAPVEDTAPMACGTPDACVPGACGTENE